MSNMHCPMYFTHCDESKCGEINYRYVQKFAFYFPLIIIDTSLIESAMILIYSRVNSEKIE